MSASQGAYSAYDSVADEYESRVATHASNTKLWVDRLARHVPMEATVLDVGCGVGLAMSLLNSKGFQPTGIDASQRMVRYAKARNPACEVINADFISFNFSRRYDVLWAEALIHLFPSSMADRIFKRLLALLKPGGVVTLSTTVSLQSSEGWLRKEDYAGTPIRFRKHWTREELTAILSANQLQVVDHWDIVDPFEKTWMVYITRQAGENSHRVDS